MDKNYALDGVFIFGVKGKAVLTFGVKGKAEYIIVEGTQFGLVIHGGQEYGVKAINRCEKLY